MRANASRQRRVQVWDEQLGATMRRPLASQPDFETPVKTGREVLIDSQGGKRARRQRTAVTELRIGQASRRRSGRRTRVAWVVRVRDRDAGRTGAAGVAAGVERGGADGGMGGTDRGLVRGPLGDRGVFPGAQERDADRGPALQDDALVKCLAFDAITAWRVFSLDRYARDAPDTPARGADRDERQVIGRWCGPRGCCRPPSAGGRFRRTSAVGWCCWRACGLAALEAATAARQRSAVAGIRAIADDGARNASSSGTLERSRCRCRAA